jgi:ABC-2 type transporter
MIQADRSVSGWKQFTEIFKRNITYLLRNPTTVRMTFINAAFISLVVLALFYKVGDVDLSKDTEGVKTRQSIFNWVGFSFMIGTNLMMTSVQNVVLQMPVQVPVFKREIMNHMYTPTAYFWGRSLSGLLIQMCSPLIMTVIVFFGIGAPITAANLFNFLLTCIQIVLVGCSIGYMCGLLFDDDNAARGICMFITLIFMLVSGGLNNAANYPPVID